MSNTNKINLIKFDIEFCEVIPSDLYGGAIGDNINILHYISHIKNNNIISKNSLDRLQYHFIVADARYNNNPEGLYIGNGFYSTVIAINCVHPSGTHIDETLVLKLLLVNKHKDQQYFDDWNSRFYLIYEKDKLFYNNLIATCYYYGDNVSIANSNIMSDMSENGIKVKKVLEDKKLVFNIFKYYKPSIDYKDVHIKKIIIFKLFVVLYYCKKNNVNINDFKWQNIGYDTQNNIVLYDYSENLINKYIIDREYILWNQIQLTLTTACYYRKLIYLKLKLNNSDTFNYIDSEFRKNISKTPINKDPIVNIMINTNIIIYQLLKQNTMVNNHGNYYSINFNPLCDKLNSLSAINIILFLCFNKVDIRKLITGEQFYEHNDIQIMLNKHQRYNDQYKWTMIDYICGFHNINDIRILDILVNFMLVPLDNINLEFIYSLKKLLFEPITECGLFAPDYENIPPYELVFKYFHGFTSDSNLYEFFRQMLIENIGTPEVAKHSEEYRAELNQHSVVTNVGRDVIDKLIELGLLKTDFDSITYEQWKFARLVEQLMDRLENRSDANIEIPPVNSTLPQSILYVVDSTSDEKIEIRKWIQNPEIPDAHLTNAYIITEEYKQALRYIETGNYKPYFSEQQLILDASPIRKNARYVVKLIKGGIDNISLSNLNINEEWGETKPYELKPELILTKPRAELRAESKAKKAADKLLRKKTSREKKAKKAEEVTESINSFGDQMGNTIEEKVQELINAKAITQARIQERTQKTDSDEQNHYYYKYLKYKDKYLKLKSELDI